MLSRSRLALSLCGLALAVPAVPAWALPDDPKPGATAQPGISLESPSSASAIAGGQPSMGYQPSMGSPSSVGHPASSGSQPWMGYQPSAGYQPMSPAASAEHTPAPAKHHHKGLFGWKHCVECQRARVKAQDGIDIPPPPTQTGMVYQGQAIMSGPMIMGDPRGMVVNESQEGGYAVVGPGAPQDGEGYAVVGGPSPTADPTPIGLARGSQNSWGDPRMAAMSMRPGGGPYDPSVVPSSLPPAPSAVASPRHDRPHIISHLFGIPLVGTHRRERDQRNREQHAAIAYGDSKQKVTELPASVVYGRDGPR